MCGAKVSDDARFCTECGTPLVGLHADAKAQDAPTPMDADGGRAERDTDLEVAPVESAPVAPSPVSASGAPQSARQADLALNSTSQPVGQASPAADFSSQMNYAAPGVEQGAPSFTDPGLASEPQQPKRSSMMSFLMERRQIGSRLVPTFAIIIASLIATIGVAYAAFMVYKNVIEPNIQQPTQQEQTVEKGRKGTAKKTGKKNTKDQKAENNKQAHAAYDEVLNQYREAFASGVTSDEDNGLVYDASVESPYWTDSQADSKFPLFNYSMLTPGTDLTADVLNYLYKDLDGDGIDELLIAEDGWDGPSSDVLAIYALVDNKVKGLSVATGYRDSLLLYSNNIICSQGNGGWAVNRWSFGCLKDGGFETEQSISEDRDDNAHTASVVCSGKVNETASDSTEGISNSDDLTNCDALIQKVLNNYSLDTSATWQPLNS